LLPAASGAAEDGGALAPLAPAAFDRAAAAHLLSRAGFGGTPEEIDAFQALGLEKAVEVLLAPAAGSSQPTAADPLPFTPLARETLSRRELALLPREKRQEKVREMRRQDAEELQRLRAWWIRRMALTRSPLAEKMALFWHGHFATSQREVRNATHMRLQNQLFRDRGLGDFRALVRAVARDPAMLRYLDGNQNRRGKPNENFARELLELFTLGLGNYTEADVKEAARAFTGWTVRGDEGFFARRAHDPGAKTFLGRTGAFGSDEVLDIIFEQPAASRFIARKLFVHFAHEEPGAEAVEDLAATLRAANWEIRAALSRLFRSAEFYSPRARGNRIKSPVELVAGTLRLLRIDPGESPAFAALAGRMGQDLFFPPNVKGWPAGKAWISTATVFERASLARAVLGLDRPPGARPDRKAAARPGPLRGPVPAWDPEKSAGAILGGDPGAVTAAEAVERAARSLLLVPLPEEARRKLIAGYEEALSARGPGGPEAVARLRELLNALLSSPEYQLG
jgi:uncharacterized protein (DUF1800 family)